MKQLGFPDSRDKYAWMLIQNSRLAFDILGMIVLKRGNRWLHFRVITTRTT